MAELSKQTRPEDYRRVVRRQAWLTLAAAVAAALLLFLITTLSHLRTDWSEGQIYTLSSSTVAVLDQIEEPLLIRAYITTGLPQPYGRLKRFLEDILRSYHEAGEGNVGFEVVDPAADPNVAAALAAMEIPRVQVQVIEDDQAEIKQGYLAVVIEYLDRKETIPVVQSEEGFEYLLTRKIKKLTGKGRAKVGVVHGFGAADLGGLRKFQEFAGDDYELVELDGESEAIASDIKAVIVAGAESAPTESFRYRLDQFRMQGGGLLLLAGNAKPQLASGFQVAAVDVYANSWISSDLGITVEPGMVMDRRATRVTVNQHQDGFMFRSVVDYPFLPQVTDLHRDHVVTAGLESVSVPFASPLVWAEGSAETGAERYRLMQSSPFSVVQSGPPFDVNPLVDMQSRFSGMPLHPSQLALALAGSARSAFDRAPASVEAGGEHVAKTDAARMIVIGSPAFLDDEFMDGGNLVAVLNMVDWLAGDEALIALRSRGITQRPLQELSAAGRSFFKGVWMFGLPLLIAMVGAGRWWLLKRRRAFPVA